MNQVNQALLAIRQWMNFPLFHIGKGDVTLWGLFWLIVLSVLLFYTTSKLKKWVVYRILPAGSIDLSLRENIGSVLRYLVIAIGFVIILQATGIDLSALTILIGSLSIGIGLGLQNITNNFVSGLIILFERPIKLGDRVEVGKHSGDVIKIAARATTILTNENIAVIVPNSEFISSAVINWSYPTKSVRIHVPIGVGYESDPEVVRKLLLEVAATHSGVLKDPPPDVLFDSFGDSAVNFVLRIWTTQFTSKPGVLRSDLNYAISRKFRENGIVIPFPQREVRLLTQPSS